MAGERWVGFDLVYCGRFGRPAGRSEDWRQWKAICCSPPAADAVAQMGAVLYG